MANTKKRRVTITVDGALLDLATEVSGSDTVSGAVGEALHLFVRTEALRRDVAAYAATPPTDQEIALAALDPDWSALADDTDWEQLHPAVDGDRA